MTEQEYIDRLQSLICNAVASGIAPDRINELSRNLFGSKRKKKKTKNSVQWVLLVQGADEVRVAPGETVANLRAKYKDIMHIHPKATAFVGNLTHSRYFCQVDDEKTRIVEAGEFVEWMRLPVKWCHGRPVYND